MARLAIPRQVGAGTGEFAGKDQGGSSGGDKYQDRLIKYIPGESVALYVGLDRLIGSHFGLQGTSQPAEISTAFYTFSVGIFLLCLVGTPLYLYRQRLPGQPWKRNAAISTVAFVFWAYTIGGTIFVLTGRYDLFIAGLLTPIFTFVAGLIEPK